MQASFKGLWLHPVFRQRGRASWGTSPTGPCPPVSQAWRGALGRRGQVAGMRSPCSLREGFFPPPGGKARCRSIHASLPRPGKCACVLRATQRLLPSGPASNGQEAPRAGSGGKEQARREPHLLTLFLPSLPERPRGTLGLGQSEEGRSAANGGSRRSASRTQAPEVCWGHWASGRPMRVRLSKTHGRVQGRAFQVFVKSCGGD